MENSDGISDIVSAMREGFEVANEQPLTSHHRMVEK